MKKWLLTALLGVFCLSLQAQEPYPQLGAKLEEYFTALSGENVSVQNAECDFLIESCKDSLVRQFVALKIYDHYLRSHIMGDDAVAVHVADKWFLSGAIAMASEEDLRSAKLFAEFNRQSLIGAQAPSLSLLAPDGSAVRVPAEDGKYSVLFFYDHSCASCRLEKTRLQEFIASGEYSLNLYAIFVGSDAQAWEKARAGFDGALHLWDPSLDSDWQRKYGVLSTPGMFLVSPDGTILGRGLDTPALRILLNQVFSSGKYVYGESGQMARYKQLFSVYGDTLSVSHVMGVADYIAERTFGEGDVDAFKQVGGDLLYFLSSQRREVFRDAAIPFVDKYVTGLPDVWSTPEDTARVVSLGALLKDLASRTPAGSPVPALSVHGVLRQKPCLFRRGTREGVFSLPALKGRPGYVVFYTAGCGLCEQTLQAVENLVRSNYKVKVLLIDMDALMTDHPEEARQLLDTFDLSGMPFVLELDRRGTVLHRYVELK